MNLKSKIKQYKRTKYGTKATTAKMAQYASMKLVKPNIHEDRTLFLSVNTRSLLDYLLHQQQTL